MLKIRNFTKCYDGKAVVDDLSLEVAAGDIYAFIGHNGAGKTTTIKAACGILQFDGGNLGGVHIGVGHTITALHTEVDRTPSHSRRKTEIYGTALIHTIGIDDGMATVFHLNIRAVVGILLDAGIFVANGVFALSVSLSWKNIE